ncbi:MAG: hypothetical protein ACHQFW_09585 [Chitinophagales bacterium]
MKKLMLLFTLFILSGPMIINASVSQTRITQIAPDNNTYKVSATGIIMLKGDIWVIRVEDSNGVTDYVPQNLSDRFKVSGIQVKFSGIAKTVSDTEKLAGIPLVLQHINVIHS